MINRSAAYTWMKIGGPASISSGRGTSTNCSKSFACHEDQIPVRVLGGGSNVLVRDEGVSGVVLQLVDESFAQIAIEGATVRAGAGGLLSQLISHTVKAELAGLETLSGIPGTVEGACTAMPADSAGDIGQFVESVTRHERQRRSLHSQRGRALVRLSREQRRRAGDLSKGRSSCSPAIPKKSPAACASCGS